VKLGVDVKRIEGCNCGYLWQCPGCGRWVKLRNPVQVAEDGLVNTEYEVRCPMCGGKP